MGRHFWKVLAWWHTRAGRDPQWSNWARFEGFRRAVGGRWELWEFEPFDMRVRLWLQTFYQTPAYATTTFPLAVEEYRDHIPVATADPVLRPNRAGRPLDVVGEVQGVPTGGGRPVGAVGE